MIKRWTIHDEECEVDPGGLGVGESEHGPWVDHDDVIAALESVWDEGFRAGLAEPSDRSTGATLKSVNPYKVGETS